jgi:hypothetical protein
MTDQQCKAIMAAIISASLQPIIAAAAPGALDLVGMSQSVLDEVSRLFDCFHPAHLPGDPR